MERMNFKPKVLVLYNKLFHYRIPVWNVLANDFDLTVAYSLGDIPSGVEIKFKVLYLPCIKLFNRFVIQKDNIRKLSKKFDAVIAYGDISWLKYSTLPWFNSTKVVFHTLGVSASYKKGYDQYTNWDRVRGFFYNQADALVFYTQYPIQKYLKLGINKSKMFEAPNTVFVEPLQIDVEKNKILMIGTLYRQKGIQFLLDSYLRLKGYNNLPVLEIIGNGPDYDLIKKWIIDNGMEQYIHLNGAVYDVRLKAEFFASALACISPSQAGLSVLESMGYGVPFVTTKDAITGGEIFNIHHGVDGVIMDSILKLDEILIDIADNPEKYKIMGRKAQEYYDHCRTIKHMANGLYNAVEFALKG